LARTALDGYRRAPTRLDLIHFLTGMLRLLPAGASPGGPAAERTRPGWLVRACAAMHREDNLREGVPRMLALAGVSPAHLSRSMRAHYGMTPTAYVQELRLRHAAHLLATTQDPITGIAYRCGFASPSYFSRCFHIAHRSSPRQFRHQALRAFVP
jgi:AraC family cel operon transcriptional repressor